MRLTIRKSIGDPRQLAVLSALLAAGVAQATERSELSRRIIEQVPQRAADPANLSFSVPFPIVKQFFLDALFPEKQKAQNAPADLIRSEWSARVVVSNDTAAVELIIEVDVLNADLVHPAQLNLFPENTVYEELTIDGTATTPIKDGSMLYVALPIKGHHQIKTRIKPTVTAHGNRKSIPLHPHEYALANLSFESSEALSVCASNAPTLLEGSKEHGTKGTLALTTSEPETQLSWEPYHATLIKDGIPSFHTSVAWIVEERALSANALMDIRITGGSREQLTLNLPPKADRVSIKGADVHDVRISGSTAKVILKGRIEGSTQLRIACTIPGNIPATLALPTFGLIGGRSTEGGWLSIANDAGGDLLEHDLHGFEAVAVQELPAEVGGLSHVTPTFCYRRATRSATASFDRVKTAPFPLVETIADTIEGECVVRPDGEELVKLNYEMRNNRAQYLRVKLPEGAQLLAVSVEGSTQTPSAVNGETWIRLPRSLQTMDGLISFPIQLVYIRKGAPILDRKQRAVNLPELIDVPTAQVSMTLYLPEALKLKRASSTLEWVDRFVGTDDGIEYGQGFSTAPWNNPKPESDEAQETLYYNYYALGLESYKKNDLKSAERFLQQAADLSDGVDKNAEGLLRNISVSSGNKSSAGKDRAKAAFITRSTSSLNLSQSSEQQQLIDEGLKLIEAGNEIAGAQLLDQADSLSSQLSARGDELGQRVAQRAYKGRLDQVRKDEETNRELKMKVNSLQKKSKQIITESSDSTRGQRLVANINAQASSIDYDAYEAEEMLFTDEEMPAPELSLSAQNEQLNRQLIVLQNALAQTEQEPWNQPVVADYDRDGISDHASRRIVQTKEALGHIVEDLSQRDDQFESGQAGFKDVELGEELEQLKDQREALDRLYGDIDADGLAEIDELIVASEQKLETARQRRESAQQVLVDPGFVDFAETDFQQQQLVNMIIDNNDFRVGDDDNSFNWGNAPVEVVNGQLAVDNYEGNAELLNETVSNLSKTGGNVVSLAGSNVDAGFLDGNSAPSQWFGQTTAQGQRYAVLDEAQFRTLQSMQSDSRAIETESGQRAVVPETWNRVAGQELKLANADIDSNGIEVGGTLINLEHNRYLAIDNGDRVTILKGSKQHNWQEQVDVLPDLLQIEVSPEIVFPAAGIPYRFEKTLLAEGESMDITLEYRLAENH